MMEGDRVKSKRGPNAPFYDALIPLMKAQLSRLNHLLKVSPPNTVIMVIKF